MEVDFKYLETEVCYLQRELEKSWICEGEKECIYWEILRIQKDIFMFSAIDGRDVGESGKYFEI